MSFRKASRPSDSSIAIEACELSKSYRVYEHPIDRLKQAVAPNRRKYYKEFWAIRNASFQIKTGDSIGIIGRNGSGKSTLLQMVCGTLSPTYGSVKVNGRVGALLELGSGFNPEFTGLENVYLNSSILGASRAETDSRLDEILGFADIGDFISQPVKTYSSGMAVRLAFSIASFLEPSILVIDEALSVGDSFFTSKCRKRMMTLRETGTTMLVVSHDLEQLASLCDMALHVESSLVSDILPIRNQIHKYLSKSPVDFTEPESDDQCSRSLSSAPGRQDVFEPREEDWKQKEERLIEAVGVDGSLATASAGRIECVASEDTILTFYIRSSAIKELGSGLFSIGLILQDLNGLSIWSACRFIDISRADGRREEVSIDIRWPSLKNGVYLVVVGIGYANSEDDPHNNTAIIWDADRVAVRSIGQSNFSTALFNGSFVS
jgi:ABC-type polysaccharide/polyol phosphate transport system ATPase subunit